MINPLSSSFSTFFSWKVKAPLITIGAIAAISAALGVVTLLNFLKIPTSVQAFTTKALLEGGGGLAALDLTAFLSLLIARRCTATESKPPPIVNSQKVQLVKMVWEAFRKSCPEDLALEVHTEVDTYFQQTVQAIEGGKDLPLPVWLHATKWGNVSSILSAGQLQCGLAKRGFGLFLSTADEYRNYADRKGLTFVFDHEAIQARTHEWRQSEGSGDYWMAVQEALPLSSETVAFATYNAGDSSIDPHRHWLLDRNIPLVTREASLLIREAFRMQITPKAFPKNVNGELTS